MITSAATIGATADYLNSYTFDTLSRVTRLTQAGQFGGQAVANKRVDFAYNAASQLTDLNRYASLNTASPVADSEYGYDPAGRLTSIAHDATAAGSTFGETHSYTYDQANRITSYANVFGGVDADYAYDPTDQLTGVDYTGLDDEAYTYDANGNRQSTASSTYEIGPYNRLLSDGTYTYEYDDEGNLIYREETNDPGDRTYYTWDHRNRLVHVSEWIGDHEVLVVNYVYDAFNQLVYRGSSQPFDEDFNTSVFIHDGGQVVLEFHEHSESAPDDLDELDLQHRYLWGPAVDQLLADEQVDWSDSDADGEVLWALTDHLGSVRDVVDSDGKARIHRNFDAFGNVVDETHYNASGATVNSGQTGYVDEAFAFTGRYFDKATGLQNNLNRWYDPAVGRWTSQDPSGFPAGDANLYRYVENKPTDSVDPDGRIPRPGRTPPKSWPPPPAGWEKWDPSSGRYNKGRRYRHWHPPDPGHNQGHWDEEDKDGGNHVNVYEYGRIDLSPFLDPIFTPKPKPFTNCVGGYPGSSMGAITGTGRPITWQEGVVVGGTIFIFLTPWPDELALPVLLPRFCPAY